MGKKVVSLISRLSDLLNGLDIRGRAMLGLFTLTIIGLCIWATLTANDIPSGVLTAYGTAVGCFAFNRTFEKRADVVPKGGKAEC